MTKEEYLDVCLKYKDIIVLNTENDAFYIKCEDTSKYFDADFQVTFFYYDDNDVGFGEVYSYCQVDDDNKIVTCLKPHHTTKDVKRFEQNLQLFIKSYKQALVDIKKYDLEKDFV